MAYAQMPLINAQSDVLREARGLTAILCFMQSAKAVVSLRICAYPHEPLQLGDAINTKFSCCVPFIHGKELHKQNRHRQFCLWRLKKNRLKTESFNSVIVYGVI